GPGPALLRPGLRRLETGPRGLLAFAHGSPCPFELRPELSRRRTGRFELGAGALDVPAESFAVETPQDLALRDAVPLADEQLDHFAGDLKRDLDLGGFDRAGGLQGGGVAG